MCRYIIVSQTIHVWFELVHFYIIFIFCSEVLQFFFVYSFRGGEFYFIHMSVRSHILGFNLIWISHSPVTFLYSYLSLIIKSYWHLLLYCDELMFSLYLSFLEIHMRLNPRLRRLGKGSQGGIALVWFD